jgi:hypothetical protein
MSSKTYLCLGSPENPEAGLLELDLVVFREKGEQTRYLNLSFAQPDENGVMKSVSVNLNEESFNNIREFFKQLDWNS